MTSTEKKRQFIINIVYTVILIALFYLFFKFAFGTILPILCAVVVAMILQKPVNFIWKIPSVCTNFLTVSIAERYCEEIVAIATPITPNPKAPTNKRLNPIFNKPPNIRWIIGRLESPLERKIAAQKL